MPGAGKQPGVWDRNPYPYPDSYENTPISDTEIQSPPPNYYHPPPQVPHEHHRFFPVSGGDTEHRTETIMYTQSGVSRGKHHREHVFLATRDVGEEYIQPTEEQLAKAMYAESAIKPCAARRPSLWVNVDQVPGHVRTNGQTSELLVPPQKPRQASVVYASRVAPLTNGAVPDRGSLQSLETWSKDQKRANVDNAKQRSRRRIQGSQRDEDDLLVMNGRVIPGDEIFMQPGGENELRDGRHRASHPIDPSTSRLTLAEVVLQVQSLPRLNSAPQSAVESSSSGSAMSPVERDLYHNDIVRQTAATRFARDPVDSRLLQGTKSQCRDRDPGVARVASLYSSGRAEPTYVMPMEHVGPIDERPRPPIRTSPSLVNLSSQANNGSGLRPGLDRVNDRQSTSRHGRDKGAYAPSVQPLEDWRELKTARLTSEDLDFEPSLSAVGVEPTLAQDDEPFEEESIGFEPHLFLKCGPLLRYTGIRKEPDTSGVSAERSVWRGSIMIVTDDNRSDLSHIPTLRIYAQDMDLVQNQPGQSAGSGNVLPSDLEDPIAGQVKLSRTGRPLYVRPVNDIDGDIDLSQEEGDDGLFAVTRTPVLALQAVAGPDGQYSEHVTVQDKFRTKQRDGECLGRYRQVRAIRLHTGKGFTFWRFNIEVELGERQHRIAYRINNGPAVGFWVPASGETMNVMFHSGNGFSFSADPDEFSGPDPLWRDVLNRHQAQPFHVMIGGGNQIYNDAVARDTALFNKWCNGDAEYKHCSQFSADMQDELEEFYLHNYAMWFSQGLFGMANAQIPMVNIWDDHDIISGYGSYSHHLMSSEVFSGLGSVAFKYYMLFQHQSLPTETEQDEPSWLLGKSPGPYIHELSRSLFLSLGDKVAFLGLDCRTERMRGEVISTETYNKIFERCEDEIELGKTKHLVVLLGVPVAYPRLNFLHSVLAGRAKGSLKGTNGMLSSFANNSDGGANVVDDLEDHWIAKNHKGERSWLIEELQELAAQKSVRITILGGNVQLACVGRFYSPAKLNIAKIRDHRYMPNVISSAIANKPLSTEVADQLHRKSKVHHLNAETDEEMIALFGHDVNGRARSNHCMLPRRNFCIIREFAQGQIPIKKRVRRHTAAREIDSPDGGSIRGRRMDDSIPRDRTHRPVSKQRTSSLSRGPLELVRKLSSSSHMDEIGRRHIGANGEVRKAAAMATASTDVEVDLEEALDISLCVEVDQHDPLGATVPYRMLVPALWSLGPEEASYQTHIKARGSLVDRIFPNLDPEVQKLGICDDDDDDDDDNNNDDCSESDASVSTPRTSHDSETERNTAANAAHASRTRRSAYARPRNASADSRHSKGSTSKKTRGNRPTGHASKTGPASASAHRKYGRDQANDADDVDHDSLPPYDAHKSQGRPVSTAASFQERPASVSGISRGRAPVIASDSPIYEDAVSPSNDSEDYEDSRRCSQPPPRRTSVAERFFGAVSGTGPGSRSSHSDSSTGTPSPASATRHNGECGRRPISDEWGGLETDAKAHRGTKHWMGRWLDKQTG